MKKLFLAFLVLFVGLTAVGCGGSSNNNVGDVDAEEGYDGSEETLTFYHTMGKNLSDV